jgi:hypothetical protein
VFAWRGKTIVHKTAIFRQINKARLTAHHDALEFSDGYIVLLTALVEGQGGYGSSITCRTQDCK